MVYIFPKVIFRIKIRMGSVRKSSMITPILLGCAFQGEWFLNAGAFQRGPFHNKSAFQGEWEGNAVDLVLGAMQAFPDAAFVGITL